METTKVDNPFGAPVYCFDRLTSTMDQARAAAAEGATHGTVIVAEAQDAGRGRIAGRLWRSAPGESLLSTTILRYPSLAALPSALTLRIGLAAAEAIESAAPFQAGFVRVKWPNDVLAVREHAPLARGPQTMRDTLRKRRIGRLRGAPASMSRSGLSPPTYLRRRAPCGSRRGRSRRGKRC